jgi:hypothetical protein
MKKRKKEKNEMVFEKALFLKNSEAGKIRR